MPDRKHTPRIEFQALIDMPIPFADDPIGSYSERHEIDLSAEYQGTVPYHKIRGCTHALYRTQTWGEVMPRYYPATDGSAVGRWEGTRGADRMIKGLDANPGWLDSLESKGSEVGPIDKWSFIRVGDDYYVTNGHNRTILYRYFLLLNARDQVIHDAWITPTK